MSRRNIPLSFVRRDEDEARERFDCILVSSFGTAAKVVDVGFYGGLNFCGHVVSFLLGIGE